MRMFSGRKKSILRMNPFIIYWCLLADRLFLFKWQYPVFENFDVFLGECFPREMLADIVIPVLGRLESEIRVIF